MKNKIRNTKNFLFATVIFSLCYVTDVHAAIDLSCYNVFTTGSWNFGMAPKGCNVTPSYTQSRTNYQYSPVIFKYGVTASTEQVRYMSKMYPLLREVTKYYIKRRKPTVTSAEIAAFQNGVYATAHQETFWTHFRKPTDNIIRYMRGDSLHGHGMMQVDDRSHLAALQQGKGIDLVYNMMYGLDVYYSAWQKAATAPCVPSPTSYRTRARAAWSGYNGGNSRICRFATAPRTGDERYALRYDEKLWLKYVSNPSAATVFNVKCLVEGVRPCALLTTTTLAANDEAP